MIVSGFVIHHTINLIRSKNVDFNCLIEKDHRENGNVGFGEADLRGKNCVVDSVQVVSFRVRDIISFYVEKSKTYSKDVINLGNNKGNYPLRCSVIGEQNYEVVFRILEVPFVTVEIQDVFRESKGAVIGLRGEDKDPLEMVYAGCNLARVDINLLVLLF